MNEKKMRTLSAERRHKKIMTVVMAIVCILWVMPVIMVVLNSFKFIHSFKFICNCF